VKPARPGQRLRTPLDNTAPANDADLFLAGHQEVSAAGGFVPLTGHILDLR
jgi:pilus assembly protein CpaC